MRSMKYALTVASAALLVGCAPPVGSYRVDSATLSEVSCTGVGADAVQPWIEALTAAPLADVQVGESGGDVQAQMTRGDGTVLYATVTETGDAVWTGTRELLSTTTASADLGADFSALLEGDGICRFDFFTEVELAYPDGYGQVDGEFVARIEESDDLDSCDILTCRAAFSFTASHTGRGNPGTVEVDGE